MTFFTEKKIFIFSLIVLIILITFSHFFGLVIANKDFYYIGNEPTRGGDMFGHFSFILQAEDGHLLFKNLYNSVPQKALFFHPLWLVMGWVAKIFNLSAFIVYQVFRLIFAVIFCFVLRRFLKKYFNSKEKVWLFPFCLFAGGLFSWLTEKDIFTCLLYSPLFSIILIFFVLIAQAFFDYYNDEKNRHLLIIFGCSLFLFLIHFYDAVTLMVLVLGWGVYQYFNSRKLNHLWPTVAAIVAVSLGAAYYYYIFSAEEALKRWAINNVTVLPSYFFLLKIYGAILPLALVGLIIKRKEKLYIFMALWWLAAFYVIVSPIPFNRRLVLGTSIPLAILAYSAFEFIFQKMKYGVKKMVVSSLIIAILLFNVMYMMTLDLLSIVKYDESKFQPRQYMETFFWMRNNLPQGETIMANFLYWDTFISGYSGLTSYLASGYYSMFGENNDKIRWFFENDNNSDLKEKFLKDNFLDYLFYSNKENLLGSFNPDDQSYLQLIYQNADARVYKVKN